MRMSIAGLLLSLPLVGAAGVPTSGAATGDVVAFNVGVRVDVDANGKPLEIQASPDLPDAIRAFVEKRVATWQYVPAKVGGVAQPATTYLAVAACAVPVAGGYRLGLDFNGNGPRHHDDKPLVAPAYPKTAMRAGVEADYELILAIGPDGRPVLESMERTSLSGGGRGSMEFGLVLRRWVETLRFDPERVAGEPVGGKIRFPVSLYLSNGPAPMRAKLQAEAKSSRECMAAADDDGRLTPVAVEPAVTVVPKPAG